MLCSRTGGRPHPQAPWRKMEKQRIVGPAWSSGGPEKASQQAGSPHRPSAPLPTQPSVLGEVTQAEEELGAGGTCVPCHHPSLFLPTPHACRDV